MGMPFPRGLQATGQGPFPAPPFYWGLNGIFSVVGSIATMVSAVIVGFTWAMLGGAAFYLVAAVASLAFNRTATVRIETRAAA
jgi:hypothetical protein